MANWARVEFTKMPRRRRMKELIPIVNHIILLCDFLACVACGQASRALCCNRTVEDTAFGNSVETSILQVALESLIVAFVLRYPVTRELKQTGSVANCLLAAETRCLFGFLFLAAASWATEPDYPGGLTRLLAWYIPFAFSLATTRLCVGWYLGRLCRNGSLREAVAIVGASGSCDRLAARISTEADIVGLYSAQPAGAPEHLGPDDLTQLLELGRAGDLDSVVIALERDQSMAIEGLVESLKALPVQLAVCADEDMSHQDEAALRMFCGVSVAVVANRPINGHGLLIKTLGDKCVALALLVVFAPLMLGIALAVGVSSQGPIIFRQTRQGWCGTRFTVYKFRTMQMPQDGLAWLHQTQRNDPRCTHVGRILRSTSLDELPQLWNVVRGDMSLVGPRPHDDSLHDLDRFGREIVAEYAQRYRVKPGITGWAQIHGARGPTCSAEQLRRRVAYDLYYIENWSPWLDLQILARTPLCLIGDNVY